VLVLLLLSEHKASLPQTNIMYITGLGSRSALIWVVGSGYRRAKMTHKYRKKIHVLKCWMFSFEGCRLLLYGDLSIGKLQFSIQKIYITRFSAVNFFYIFGHQNPGFGTGSGSATRKTAGHESALNQCRSTTQAHQ
jgi:hypothetical protein